MHQRCASINESSTIYKFVQFSLHDVYDYKSGLSKTFNPLVRIKNNLAFKFHMCSLIDHDRRVVFVDVFQTAGANENQDQSVALLRPSETYCNLSQFEKNPPDPLNHARNCKLSDNVFNVLLKSRPNLSTATTKFCLDELGCRELWF